MIIIRDKFGCCYWEGLEFVLVVNFFIGVGTIFIGVLDV